MWAALYVSSSASSLSRCLRLSTCSKIVRSPPPSPPKVSNEAGTDASKSLAAVTKSIRAAIKSMMLDHRRLDLLIVDAVMTVVPRRCR